MKLNIYTYKGPSTSLINLWVTCGFLTSLNYCNINIPKGKYLYSYKKNLDKYKDVFNSNSIFVKTIKYSNINYLGELASYNAEQQIKAQAKSFMELKEPFDINIFEEPLNWDERLCVIYSVFIRDQYLHKISTNSVNYYKLDINLNTHLNLIKNYKYLPPFYNVDKCLYYFRNVYPKPKWFNNEIDFINNNIK